MGYRLPLIGSSAHETVGIRYFQYCVYSLRLHSRQTEETLVNYRVEVIFSRGSQHSYGKPRRYYAPRPYRMSLPQHEQDLCTICNTSGMSHRRNVLYSLMKRDNQTEKNIDDVPAIAPHSGCL